jgi:hypothetical protein
VAGASVAGARAAQRAARVAADHLRIDAAGCRAGLARAALLPRVEAVATRLQAVEVVGLLLCQPRLVACLSSDDRVVEVGDEHDACKGTEEEAETSNRSGRDTDGLLTRVDPRHI